MKWTIMFGLTMCEKYGGSVLCSPNQASSSVAVRCLQGGGKDDF